MERIDFGVASTRCIAERCRGQEPVKEWMGWDGMRWWLPAWDFARMAGSSRESGEVTEWLVAMDSQLVN
jgi:hypothetical protein